MDNLLVEFSGGESSGFMTETLLRDYKNKYNMVVCFANTGQEVNETIEFVNNCFKRWESIYQAKCVWIEPLKTPKGTGTQHKVVSYKTALMGSKYFEEMSEKYGIPNVDYKHCTRELKLNPIHHYINTVVGWKKGEYKTAIGIRNDEPKRHLKEKNKTPELFQDIAMPEKKDCWQKVIHPMVTLFPVTKQDVVEFWEDMPFQLGIEQHQGNCFWCYKKSEAKHVKLIKENRSAYDVPKMLEEKYGHIGNNKKAGVGLVDEPRTIFRNYWSTETLISFADEMGEYSNLKGVGRCSEEECSTMEDEQYELFSE